MYYFVKKGRFSSSLPSHQTKKEGKEVEMLSFDKFTFFVVDMIK